MSFVTEVINPFINVRNKIMNSQGQWVDVKKERQEQFHTISSYDMSPGEEQVIFERWGKKIIIDGFSYGTTSNETVYPRLIVKEHASGRGSNNLFGTPRSNGSRWDATTRYLRDQGNDFLELRHDDTENREYTVGLRKPIILPVGGKLSIISNDNFDPDTQGLSFSVYYRVYEEE